MREKVKFNEGSPVMVKLDFNDGTQCTSRDGSPQFQYTLDDDLRIMYVDPPIRNYILAEGCLAGDVVQITKHGADARQWEVHKALRSVQGAAAFPPTEAASQPAAKRTRHAQQPAQVQAPVTSRTAELVAALISAIDAAEEAEKYAAKTYNCTYEFDAVDIRTMANSIICRKEGR